MTYDFLQHYWCFIVALLGALLVFLLFVQGANSVARSLGYTEEGRRLVYNSYACHLRRSVLRLVPLVLFHQLRRCLLAVDDYPVHLRATGCQL